MKRILLLLSLACAVLTMSAQTLERVSPESVGMDAQRLANADAAIEQAIQKRIYMVLCWPWCAMARWHILKLMVTSASTLRTSL